MITGPAEQIAWSRPGYVNGVGLKSPRSAWKQLCHVFKHNCLFLVSMFDAAGQSFLLLPPLRMTTGSASGVPERISGPFCLFDLFLMTLV